MSFMSLTASAFGTRARLLRRAERRAGGGAVDNTVAGYSYGRHGHRDAHTRPGRRNLAGPEPGRSSGPGGGDRRRPADAAIAASIAPRSGCC